MVEEDDDKVVFCGRVRSSTDRTLSSPDGQFLGQSLSSPGGVVPGQIVYDAADKPTPSQQVVDESTAEPSPRHVGWTGDPRFATYMANIQKWANLCFNCYIPFPPGPGPYRKTCHTLLVPTTPDYYCMLEEYYRKDFLRVYMERIGGVYVWNGGSA